MRPLGLGLVAALVVAFGSPAFAADEVSSSARKQGMAEAPAVAQAAGLSCQVSDARLIGKSADAKTKAQNTYYEVACGPSQIGYILQAAKDTPPAVFSCIEANSPAENGKAALPCILPANANPTAGLAPLMASTGVICTPAKARGIGQNKTSTFLEVACAEGPGYVVIASAPLDLSKKAEAQDCLNYDLSEGNVKCTLSDRATRLKVVDKYVTAANNGCVVKERGFIGASQDGSAFYEASCQDGKGYIYKADTKGGLVGAFECAKAQGILGGCKLTDARAAETQQAGLYTRLAKSAGSSCDVTKYAVFPTNGADEVVELICADGKGAVGIFKATGPGSQVLDCAHSQIAGYKCSLTPDAGWGALTADLRKLNLNSCTVSNGRVAGKTPEGSILVEVACSDGFKGYMLKYKQNPVQAIEQTGCAFSDCKLPGNT